jgi:hypothetical protein
MLRVIKERRLSFISTTGSSKHQRSNNSISLANSVSTYERRLPPNESRMNVSTAVKEESSTDHESPQESTSGSGNEEIK